ncbi:MAG: hypothetical protein JSV84_12150 [Gemmatimonadota bacterium]|nr:MAG: hypothetical protein JSV84_12150 [Gemmatimonadota bacterium]
MSTKLIEILLIEIKKLFDDLILHEKKRDKIVSKIDRMRKKDKIPDEQFMELVNRYHDIAVKRRKYRVARKLIKSYNLGSDKLIMVSLSEIEVLLKQIAFNPQIDEPFILIKKIRKKDKVPDEHFMGLVERYYNNAMDQKNFAIARKLIENYNLGSDRLIVVSMGEIELLLRRIALGRLQSNELFKQIDKIKKKNKIPHEKFMELISRYCDIAVQKEKYELAKKIARRYKL